MYTILFVMVFCDVCKLILIIFRLRFVFVRFNCFYELNKRSLLSFLLTNVLSRHLTKTKIIMARCGLISRNNIVIFHRHSILTYGDGMECDRQKLLQSKMLIFAKT